MNKKISTINIYMDQIVITAVDELLKPNQIPDKSSLSGPDLIPVYSQEGSTNLPANGSTIVRFVLPKYYGKVLTTSKSQTGAFWAFTLNTSSEFRGEPYGVIGELRILVNGVEISNNRYYPHTYAEWLKTKREAQLKTDLATAGVSFTSDVGFDAVSGLPNGTKFIVPLPDNYSIITAKGFALPLGEINVELQVVLNNHTQFLTKADGSGNLTSCSVSDMRLYVPVASVSPMVYDALSQRLKEADQDETKSLLYPLQNVNSDSQSYTFKSGGGEVNLVFNSISSSTRLLMAKFGGVPQASSGYKIMTGLNPNIQSYSYIIDGKKNQQSDPTLADYSYDLGYSLYKDAVSTYNVAVNNEYQNMGVITPAIYNGGANKITYPNHNEALETSCVLACNMDTVSNENLMSGQSVINQLTLNVKYGTVGENDVPSNVYLIQHTNQIVAISATKCKVMK